MSDALTPEEEALYRADLDLLHPTFDCEWASRSRRLLATLDATRAAERTLDVEVLAEALHDAMCPVSHHDRPPARCHSWSRYPLIAESVGPRYAAIIEERSRE